MEKSPQNPQHSGSTLPKKAEEKLQSLKPPAHMPRWKRSLGLGTHYWHPWLSGFCGILVAYLNELPGLPTIDDAAAQSQATRIYDVNGALITQLAIENRTLVELGRYPRKPKKSHDRPGRPELLEPLGVDVKGGSARPWSTSGQERSSREPPPSRSSSPKIAF